MKTFSNAYVLGFIVTLCIFIVETSAHSTFRTRPRSTRGFKNAALSTARGFGKRDGYIPNSQPAMEFPFDYRNEINGNVFKPYPVAEKFSIDWFVDEFSKNPRLAKIIIKKYFDKNQDDELSSDELFQNVEY